MNASLVTIESQSKAYFMERLTSPDTVWIGLSDSNKDGVWEWNSGSTSPYRNWGINKPDGITSEHCAVIDGGNMSRWDDRSCAENHTVICEKGD